MRKTKCVCYGRANLKLLGNVQWLKAILDLTLTLNYKDVTCLINPQHPIGSVAASRPKGEYEEATESHQLSSTATTTFHAMEGNDHRVFFSCKGTAFQRQKEKNQYCVWGKKKKLFSLTKLE